MCTSKTLNAFFKCFKRMKHMQKQTCEKQSTHQISYLFKITHPYFEPIECTGMRVRAIHPHYHDNTDCVTLSVNCGIDFQEQNSAYSSDRSSSVSVFLLDVSFSTYSFTQYVCVCVSVCAYVSLCEWGR